MQNRVSYYVAAVFLAAVFMTAGCATNDLARRDEGIVSTAAARPTDQSKSNVTPSRQAAVTPASQAAASTTTPANRALNPALNTASAAQLQSALEKIYFEFDSASLSETARAALNKNAATLMKRSSAKISIEGNCDELGSAEYNLALGERRAKAAQQYLVTNGVKADRLSVISYGKEKPAVQGSSETAWAKNRRDEFVVVSP